MDPPPVGGAQSTNGSTADRGRTQRSRCTPTIHPRIGSADVLLAAVLVRAAKGVVMGHARNVVHIDAPAEVAWEVGRDANRVPEWNTTVVEVKDVTGPLDQVGAEYTATSKIVGRTIETRWRVDEVDPGRRAVYSATAPGGGSVRIVATYEPDRTGTNVIAEVDYQLPLGFLGATVDKLFAERAVERDIKHSGENFKALVESEARVPAR